MTTTERYRHAWLSARRRALSAARHYASDRVHLDELNLTTRTYNALRRGGIESLGDLVKHTDADLLDLRGFGTGCLDEVSDALALRGRSLARWSGGSR